jgi:hypothetical protein
MAGITIDPKLAGFGESQPAPAPQAIGGGVTIDPSMVDFSATQQQAAQPTAQAPSGFAQGAADPLYAISQIVAKGLEQLPEGAKFMGRPVAASARAFNERVVPQRESDYQAQRASAGETGLDYARMGGNVATGLIPGALIAKGAGLVAPASRGIQAALSGGAGSALMTPVESSTDFWQNKAQQAGVGALTGYGVDKTLGAVISPAMTAAGQRLKDMGIQLTPGQAFGGMTQTIEDLLAKLPITGSTARTAQEKSLESFNTGVANQSLAKIGEELPKGTVGRDAISYLYNKASDAFEKVKPKIELGSTLNLYTGLRDISKGASSLNEDQARYLNNFIADKINSKLAKGAINGSDFKSLDAELGKKAANYGKGVGSDADFADALYGLRQLLRNELRTVDPTDAVSLDQLKAANSVWADKLRIERAASYLGSKDGVFTPDQLKAASKALDSTANKSATSQGKALLQPEAEAGVRAGIRGATSPTQVGGGLEFGAGSLGGGALLAGGSLPLSAALPAAPLTFYTQPMQKLFNAAMMSGRPAAAPAVRQMLPAAVAPGFTGGLLRDENIPRIELTGMAR